MLTSALDTHDYGLVLGVREYVAAKPVGFPSEIFGVVEPTSDLDQSAYPTLTVILSLTSSHSPVYGSSTYAFADILAKLTTVSLSV